MAKHDKAAAVSGTSLDYSFELGDPCFQCSDTAGMSRPHA